MSYRQSKLVQRFLAAVAAFFFVSYNLFFPVTVQASPVLGLAAAVEDVLYFAPAAELAVGLATGGIIAAAGLAVGALAYNWYQSQTTSLESKAVSNHCTANPTDCPDVQFEATGYVTVHGGGTSCA